MAKSNPVTLPHSLRRLQAGGLALAGVGLILLGLMVGLLAYRAGKQVASNAVQVEFSASPVEVDYPAPEIKLNDLRGLSVNLVDYRGKIVLVNNWATWCPPCKAEMPELEAYYQGHQKQGFVLIGIDAGEPAAKVAEFVKEYQLSFPIWLDPLSSALTAFKNDALPSSYVIDREGIVRMMWVGAITREKLEKFVTPLLLEE